MCLHPIDTIKTVIQRSSGSWNIISAIGHIFEKRGMSGFYRGISSNLSSSAPISAIYTTTYEAVKTRYVCVCVCVDVDFDFFWNKKTKLDWPIVQARQEVPSQGSRRCSLHSGRYGLGCDLLCVYPVRVHQTKSADWIVSARLERAEKHDPK